MNDIGLDERLAELSRISDGQFAERANADAGADLMARIVGTDPTDDATRRRRFRHRLPVVAGGGVTAVAASAAIGWAITNSGATDTVAVQCEIDGADAVIPAVTGDPVADCSAEWQRMTGSQPPPLTAYDNGHGGITVAPASQPPAPSAVPLPPGTTQNVSAITLQETFDDYVAGLNATCHSADSAVAFVRQELQAAGLEGWSVS